MNQTAAYFDVDETLTHDVTLFSFLRHDAHTTGQTEQAETFLRELAARRAQGEPRESTNRYYYQWWKGRDVQKICDLAGNWWAGRLQKPDLFLRSDVLARYEWHSRQGHARILLSGSFVQLIEPLAAALDVTRVIATVPLTGQGRFTGEIGEPLIGDAKRTALLADARDHGIDLTTSHGYGDHRSDLPFLSVLGHPHLVTPPGKGWQDPGFPITIWPPTADMHPA
ncbi:HAD-IB family hydrolase [Arthrobacter sp.]|uniref:HAD family hydrolase n=1 Tax=Arthrobacter sp. TaxID=1667 RepID=UPI002590B6A7|nr:HAD-IB family hydrolase [Arthrobacter sp.]